MPESNVSPDSSLIFTIRFGSSTVILLSASTNLGRSFGCFGSIAIVTTGSETYLIDSNAGTFLTDENVSPAIA